MSYATRMTNQIQSEDIQRLRNPKSCIADIYVYRILFQHQQRHRYQSITIAIDSKRERDKTHTQLFPSFTRSQKFGFIDRVNCVYRIKIHFP
jgi:hypothetical protein